MDLVDKRRKGDHIALSLKQGLQEKNAFDEIRFVHQSLPGIDFYDVDIRTNLGPLALSSPFFINAMTGGSASAERINHDLAIVARETGLAIASGSVSIALKNEDV